MSLIDKLKKDKVITEYIARKEDNNNRGFISTGVLPIDILFSGRIKDGGIPIGKISMIASPSSLGKSFIGYKIVRNAQKKGMSPIIIDTEYAFDYNFAENVGINTDNLLVIQNNQIEEVQKVIMSLVKDLSLEERQNIVLVLDSFGGLVTSKTLNDAEEGKDVSDMTISKKKNNFAKLLLTTKTTIFVVNHVYDNVGGFGDPMSIPGGRGIAFVSSSIVMGMSKAKDKDKDEISGAIVTAKIFKGRFAREHIKLKYLIKYDGGLHPVYGLLDDLLEFGYITKPSNGFYSRDFSVLGIEGEDKKWREKQMWENWKEFFTPILKNPEVQLAFEKKYSFQHSEIVDDNIDFNELEIIEDTIINQGE